MRARLTSPRCSRPGPKHAATVHLACVVALVVGAAACGGDDDTGSGTSDAPTETGGEPTDDTASAAADETTSVEEVGANEPVSDLAASHACLESTGMTVTPADEADTAFSPEYYRGLGIVEMLVFDKGAGWGGTIEAYETSDQADIAEQGYIESEWGFEVGRFGDIVFKTTGPADDLPPIAACLEDPTAEPISAAPASTAPPSTEPTSEMTSVPTVEEIAAEVDLAGDHLAIFEVLTDPALEAQDVIFDRACLSTLLAGLSDADAAVSLANNGDRDDPALSTEGAATLDIVFSCLDGTALAPVIADGMGADQACVESELAALDLEAASIAAEADIDRMFGILADAAAVCAQ